ncbi:unnamed protein product [Brachionus calyciflorus]|uniref:Uncharacterized protein n=1 Tax=Brachionus calyciflorus TaxID=104777 RepID=A0A813WWB6_9BILA|nr:unnamed protein product [Brachionus calyciflorus]
MAYHWASNNVKQTGYDDMVLLPKITDQAIFDNLKKRLMDNYIYTYIGPVLIAVNPYKELPYFTDEEIEKYRGATQIENPPHIYAIADFMYRNMLIDNENQCVIISGESGAGKTVSAKYIMSYISKVSGGNQSHKVQNIKNIILLSNPLLEAFGNAKTLRNNNSSRFGKYVEIQFTRSGEPEAGRITNFLLEKSRVVGQMKNERNFHIFYQICSYKNDDFHKKLGIVSMSRFNYLSRSGCFEVDGVDDQKDFNEVLNAMRAVKISDEDQFNIFKLVAGILHLGNVNFVPHGNYAQPENMDALEYPSYLLGISKDSLRTKLISRTIETKAGSMTEKIDVTLNVEQADHTKNALAKGIYARVFDYLVNVINSAMEVKHPNLLNIGILDIYGFEIFEQNGFEQFCINYVNEKLQQIFIELTLKAEQEEYKQEGIKWTDISFFNNKIVCDLIESKTTPPGIFSILDDVVITMHATGDGVDKNLLQKLQKSYSGHPHFNSNATGFLINHYAGDVNYDIDGFCEKNRDVLFQDLVDLMKSSSCAFVRNLFPDQPIGPGKRPTTAGNKIKTQANQLVEKLMKCYPSYIRCIKPNDVKQPKNIDEERVKHQIKYLGLVENVRIRRAGFAYRREFQKFLQRYDIVSKQTKFWKGPVDKGIKMIMDSVNMDPQEWQMGKTKVFIKSPESLFLLEEIRDRRYNEYAVILQKAFRKFNAVQFYLKLKNEAADLLYQKKERRENSVNRKFYADYIGLDRYPGIQALIPKRENIEFAQTCYKYERKFKPQKRDLILTNKAIYIIGRERVKDKNKKKSIVEVIKRRIEYMQLNKIILSHYCDNFMMLVPYNQYGTLLNIEFKTEFLTTFTKRYKESHNKDFQIDFCDSIEYEIKKDGFFGGGSRILKFVRDPAIKDVSMNPNGKTCTIRVPSGLPNTTRPSANYYQKNFESEPWWPKFEQLKNRFNITIVKGDKSRLKNIKNSSENKKPFEQNQFNNIIKNNPNQNFKNGQLNIPQMTNPQSSSSLRQEQDKIIKPPLPASRKPKVPEPNYPKCRAMYAYQASDPDELSFEENDIIYLVKEKEPEGWWIGICKGKSGLFPSNYVEKI